MRGRQGTQDSNDALELELFDLDDGHDVRFGIGSADSVDGDGVGADGGRRRWWLWGLVGLIAVGLIGLVLRRPAVGGDDVAETATTRPTPRTTVAPSTTDAPTRTTPATTRTTPATTRTTEVPPSTNANGDEIFTVNLDGLVRPLEPWPVYLWDATESGSSRNVVTLDLLTGNVVVAEQVIFGGGRIVDGTVRSLTAGSVHAFAGPEPGQVWVFSGTTLELRGGPDLDVVIERHESESAQWFGWMGTDAAGRPLTARADGRVYTVQPDSTFALAESVSTPIGTGVDRGATITSQCDPVTCVQLASSPGFAPVQLPVGLPASSPWAWQFERSPSGQRMVAFNHETSVLAVVDFAAQAATPIDVGAAPHLPWYENAAQPPLVVFSPDERYAAYLDSLGGLVVIDLVDATSSQVDLEIDDLPPLKLLPIV